MKCTRPRLLWSCSTALTLFAALLGSARAQSQNDPLPSWNNTPAKQAILSFVNESTSRFSPKFVEPGDRISTFDQDGTLWTEHPLYAQGMFLSRDASAPPPLHYRRAVWSNSESFGVSS
jgi:hypothetical protein